LKRLAVVIEEGGLGAACVRPAMVARIAATLSPHRERRAGAAHVGLHPAGIHGDRTAFG
jgi:hypothetical protein